MLVFFLFNFSTKYIRCYSNKISIPFNYLTLSNAVLYLLALGRIIILVFLSRNKISGKIVRCREILEYLPQSDTPKCMVTIFLFY